MIAVDLQARVFLSFFIGQESKSSKEKKETSDVPCKLQVFPFFGCCRITTDPKKKRPDFAMSCVQHRVVCLCCLLQDNKAGQTHKDRCPLKEYLLFGCSSLYLLQDKNRAAKRLACHDTALV